MHRYPGRIAIDNGGLKYWYGVSIFWNKTEESRFKSIDENFDGMMPNHDMMKVYMFPSNELYFEEDLLSDIQNEVAFFDLANKNNATFGAAPVGIYNLDDYLVVPNGVEFYIDKEFVKPDGSSINMNDLHPSVRLGNFFSQGSIPVLHDYEYVQIDTIWFVVDSRSDQESIDAHIDEIRSFLKSHVSQCLEYKRAHPNEADSPCPNMH